MEDQVAEFEMEKAAPWNLWKSESHQLDWKISEPLKDLSSLRNEFNEHSRKIRKGKSYETGG